MTAEKANKKTYDFTRHIYERNMNKQHSDLYNSIFDL